MELPEIEIMKSDIELSNFARALAIPVRISILRILKDGLEMNQDDFVNFPLNCRSIAQHLQDLRKLGIITSKSVKRKTYYSINKELFQKMAVDFDAFFDCPQNDLLNK